jgi:DNA polymerase III alpha subunit
MPARFVPLHLHSEYSLVDSTIRIPELVAACAARGLPAVAITDQNNLFALVKFYKEAEKAGIKPIAGADVLVAEGTAAPSRLTLLCRDNDGYLSLSQILTRAWMEGHRVDGVVARPAWLAENAGLFAIAGPQSEPGQLFASGRHDLAEQALADLQAKFGDRLHLELLRTGRAGWRPARPARTTRPGSSWSWTSSSRWASRLLPDRRRLHQLGEAARHPGRPGPRLGAGSLVAWALGITDLDPLPYDLLFERFLNPERVSMPDFDIDFCMDRRDEVIDYVARSTAATASARSSPTARWRRRRWCATPAACSASRTASSTDRQAHPAADRSA